MFLGMGSKVHLVHHLDEAELYRLYREEKDGTHRSHLQIVWLLTSGRSAQFVSEVTGYSQRWISVIIGRYNEAGVEGLGDLRRFNPGSRPLLDTAHRDRLRADLEDPPPDRGLWTARKVAQWIAGMLGRLVPVRSALNYLHRLNFTRQVPRPRHVGADWLAQETFKARFRARMQALVHEDSERPLEVWAFDEHRAGLKPVIRRVWAPRGQRPTAAGQHRFQWRYVYGFVRPGTGQVVWFLADAVNTAMFTEVLAAFAREVGAGTDKRVVLVLDGAGWHVATDLIVPEGIELVVLPPYSPELQPAECLWPLLREAVANDHIEDLADLDQILGDRCNALTDDPDTIRGRTLFHWWPAFA
jgi:hypothetical protein